MKLSSAEYSRLSRDDQQEYRDRYGTNFTDSPAKPMPLPSPMPAIRAATPAPAAVPSGLPESKLTAEELAVIRRRVEAEAIGNSPVKILRAQSNYKFFRSLLNVATLLFFILTIWAKLLSLYDGVPQMQSVSLFTFLAVLIAWSVGHILADIADLHWRKS